MSKARNRTLWLAAILSAITVLVQWSGLSSVLDTIAGFAWSAGFVRFLKTNTQGMVIMVMLSLFFEFIGFDESKERARREVEVVQELAAESLRATPTRALARHCLELEYGAEGAEQLMHCILRRSPVLRDFCLRIRVSPRPSGAFEVWTSLTYETDSSRYILGITDKPLHAETLLSTGLLAEVIVVDDMTPVRATPAVVPVQVNWMRRNGQAADEVGQLEWTLLSGRRKGAVLKAAGLLTMSDEFSLFEGQPLKRRKSQPNKVIQYEVVTTTVQPASRPYSFWLSDRVLHVKSIEVDLSALGPTIFSEARIHLFIAALPWAGDLSSANGRWSLPVNKWLVNGQGLMVIWPTAASAMVPVVA
jgi:hypothetical protein